MSKKMDVDSYLESHLNENIGELAQLCAQPSISTINLGLAECATLVEKMLKKRGFMTKLIPSAGAPVVFGERKGRSEKTILFYNHYDVQPPEPLELWTTPPFAPNLRDGKLYARGATDDKGEIMTRLAAIDALLETEGELPCTIKFCIEGEEESSSEHIRDVVLGNKDLLAADACIWEFGEVDSMGHPRQYLGVRGISYVELSVETAKQDVHSGLGGSIFPNAAWRLIWALNSLKDENERILIDGFYDRVKKPSERDTYLMGLLPETSEEYRQMYGVRQFLKGINGGVELRMAEVMEPTCTICGITSGYQGPGCKTVLPHFASAKVDFRLVPDQISGEVVGLLRKHLDSRGFTDVTISDLGHEGPSRTDPDDPFVRLVVAAADEVYEKPMLLVPSVGGSGPNQVFAETLNIPIVTAGCGYPGGNTHAPNEHVRLDLFLLCAKHLSRVMTNFAMMRS
jgi:acetylornithine deacetylase/succinyl-diaminopimelate desuccinylase-like protein